MAPLIFALLFTACGQDEPPQDSAAPDPAEAPLAGECPMAQDLGGFLVSSEEGRSGVDGAVADGVVPISVLEQIASEGDCRLMRRNNPYCDPACEPGFTCDFEGACLPYPSNQDLGAVTITGLAAPVELEPVFPGNTYYDTSLPSPPFDAGDLITLRMPGGAYGPATLYGVGVEAIVPLDEEWSVEDGVDLLVRWQAPSGAVNRGEIALSLNIDQHGATPGTLLCSFEDDGQATVPAGILQALIATGVTGYPSGALERRTQDRVDVTAGCMDFTVASPATVRVDVVGYTPCVSDADCPDGQECNLELQICEEISRSPHSTSSRR
mgnify:CR=1 FL=1